MEEFKESKFRLKSMPSNKGYIRGKAKKWFDYELSIMQRKHQEIFIFLGLAIKKGFKTPIEGSKGHFGIKRKRKSKQKKIEEDFKEHRIELVLSECMDFEPSKPENFSSAGDSTEPVSMELSDDQIEQPTINLAKYSEIAEVKIQD